MRCLKIVLKKVGWMLLFFGGGSLAIVGLIWISLQSAIILGLPKDYGLGFCLLYVAIAYGTVWGVTECRRAA